MSDDTSITPAELRQLPTFYIYEHWREDKNVCFYVGKGTGRRAWNMHQRSEHHKRITGKLAGQIKVVIVADGLSEGLAFAAEIARISHWRAAGHPLVNQTDGGEGASGLVMTDEAKRRISEKHRGKKLSQEHRSALSAAQIRRFEKPAEREKVIARNTGRKQTPETIAKRSAKLTGRKMPQAFCEAIGARMRGRVVSEATRDKLRSANIGKRVSPTVIAKKRESSPAKKAVRCLDTGFEYASASEAARVLGLNKSHIAEVCRGRSSRKSAGGYHFKFAEIV